MSAVLEPKTAAVPSPPPAVNGVPSAASPASAGQILLLENVGWQAYEMLGEAFWDKAGVRMTYDRERLAIMTLSPEHEGWSSLLNRLLEILAEESNTPMKNLGSITLKQADLERGLEPDRCYYVANLPRVRGLKRIDLTRDPPPDLAIEVEVTQSAVSRLPIYSALQVPEVWRFDGERIAMLGRSATGAYEELPRSRIFPMVSAAELLDFMRIGQSQDDTTMARAFRQWLRQRLATPAPEKPE